MLTLDNPNVNPNTQSSHQVYNFYIRVTSNGGSQAILPTAGSPYVLDVGCTSEASVGFTDSGSPFN